MESNDQKVVSIGILIDSVVEGVKYETTSGQQGFTNSKGEFKYSTGDVVKFTVGGIQLGEVTGGEIITPLDLAVSNSTANQKVINLTRFLQTIDDDENPENGIYI